MNTYKCFKSFCCLQLHDPNQDKPCELRVELEFAGVPYDATIPKQPSGEYDAKYSTFAVGSEADLYRLAVGGFDKSVPSV